MVTFETEEEFQKAVMATLRMYLNISVNSRHGDLTVELRDHTYFPSDEIASDSTTLTERSNRWHCGPR